MKTKTFMEKVRDLGYSIQLENHTQYKWADITVDDDDLMERDKQVARISTGWEAWGDLYHMQFSGHNEIELLNVITEYLVTPLEEREEEKKYVYRMNCAVVAQEYLKASKRGVVRFEGVRDFSTNEPYFKSKFTDAEVENYPEEVRELFKICEKIEVTP